jgi:DNA-directed RNA polymerase subunit F
MILEQRPITMSEVKALAKNLDEKTPLHEYLKKFVKLSAADANKMLDELRALNSMKLREEHFVKIVDFLPQDNEELSKVVPEASLTEEEMQAILAISKKY